MPPLDSGSQDLSREECLALLPSVPVGRIAFTQSGLPAVIPVNFVVDGGQIVVRVGAGSVLAAAVRGSTVAFEADDFDDALRNGWTVTVVGQARQVTEAMELERLASLGLVPYAGTSKKDYIAVPTDLVSGRRVGTGPLGTRSSR